MQVLGETSITYRSGSEFYSIPIPFAIFKAHEKLDRTRYLLADHQGGLHFLQLDAPMPQP